MFNSKCFIIVLIFKDRSIGKSVPYPETFDDFDYFSLNNYIYLFVFSLRKVTKKQIPNITSAIPTINKYFIIYTSHKIQLRIPFILENGQLRLELPTRYACYLNITFSIAQTFEKRISPLSKGLNELIYRFL